MALPLDMECHGHAAAYRKDVTRATLCNSSVLAPRASTQILCCRPLERITAASDFAKGKDRLSAADDAASVDGHERT
jgi:hypothetical protein